MYSKYFLTYKIRNCEQVVITDYRDYSGVAHSSNAPMKQRTHLNRLEKYFRWYGDEQFYTKSAVWELTELFSEFESSSDEEEPIRECPNELSSGSEFFSSAGETSEEEGESSEGEEFDLKLEVENKYVVMKTGKFTSFAENEQLFNCYGRLNNFDLLLEYGFALLPNRHDSFLLRVLTI